jgi:hypothetical protein
MRYKVEVWLGDERLMSTSHTDDLAFAIRSARRQYDTMVEEVKEGMFRAMMARIGTDRWGVYVFDTSDANEGSPLTHGIVWSIGVPFIGLED